MLNTVPATTIILNAFIITELLT